MSFTVNFSELCSLNSGGGRLLIGGGGHIHIFVLIERKNNRFQKELIMQNTNI